MVKGKEALLWIVKILNENNIPYQIEGGLAAIYYGSKRDLIDIDIFIPSFGFNKIHDKVKKYITFGPDFHAGTHWKLIYLKLKYHNQQIEICDADNAEYLDTTEGKWIKRNIDFSKSELGKLFDTKVCIIPKKDLIDYKKRLNRDVDKLDIDYIFRV